MATIINTPPPQIINQSGIAHNLAKMQSIPTGWNQVDEYEEEFNPEAQRVTTVFQGPWSTRKAFVNWALGYSTNAQQPGAIIFQRAIPAQNFTYPWLYAQRCRRIKGQGAITEDPNAYAQDGRGGLLLDPNGAPVKLPAMAYTSTSPNVGDTFSCRIAVEYEALDYEVRDDAEMVANNLTELARYVTRKAKFSQKTLPIPGWMLKFVDGPGAGQPIAAAAGNFIIPLTEWHYTLNWWPDQIDRQTLEACRGRVNANALDPSITTTTLRTVGPSDPDPNEPFISSGSDFVQVPGGGLPPGPGGTFFSQPQDPQDPTNDPTGNPALDQPDPNSFFDKPYTVTAPGFPPATIAPAGPGFAPGTLLCDGIQQERIPRTIVGRVAWHIEIVFLENPFGWNRFPFPAKPGGGAIDPQEGLRFWLATQDGTPNGPRQYGAADFNQLFRPPTGQLYQGPLG